MGKGTWNSPVPNILVPLDISLTFRRDLQTKSGKEEKFRQLIRFPHSVTPAQLTATRPHASRRSRVLAPLADRGSVPPDRHLSPPRMLSLKSTYAAAKVVA
jgi:hypothetical protein